MNSREDGSRYIPINDSTPGPASNIVAAAESEARDIAKGYRNLSSLKRDIDDILNPAYLSLLHRVEAERSKIREIGETREHQGTLTSSSRLRDRLNQALVANTNYLRNKFTYTWPFQDIKSDSLTWLDISWHRDEKASTQNPPAVIDAAQVRWHQSYDWHPKLEIEIGDRSGNDGPVRGISRVHYTGDSLFDFLTAFSETALVSSIKSQPRLIIPPGYHNTKAGEDLDIGKFNSFIPKVSFLFDHEIPVICLGLHPFINSYEYQFNPLTESFMGGYLAKADYIKFLDELIQLVPPFENTTLA